MAPNLVTPLVANFLELRADTLVVFDESAGRGIWSFPLDQVTRLETTAGEQRGHRRFMMRGALYGGGAGAVAGLLFAATFSPSDSTRKYSRPLTGLLGAAIGAGAGALIGSRFSGEKWRPVPIPRQTSFAPDGRGGWRITLGF
jgi:hypothetical protein